MKDILIGRHKERKELIDWVESDRSEFIAIYGRRRVGKTFLVKKALENRFTFTFSGSYGQSRNYQLLNFSLALRDYSGNQELPVPPNWIMAFHELKTLIVNSENRKKIIFIDEVPWLDTPKSGFIAALENFWNSWASWRDDVKLIVCGSATSWIINKIIRNKGGLHNRVTHTMLLHPFHLKECREYFDTYNFGMSKMQIAECYMTMGGIPYYFSLMDRGESLAQNIDRLFFKPDAPLKTEFENLYRSLYKNYKPYIKIIEALSGKGMGLTRKEILSEVGLINNGEFSRMLEELELCGFIRSYVPFESGKKNKYSSGIRTNRDTLYQLIDFYSLFYLEFKRQLNGKNGKFWSNNVNSPKLNAWRGLTFEMLCLYHIDYIKEALGIGDVSTNICSWRGGTEESKAQIDLLIDRKDNAINLCEMKFSQNEYTIDKRDAEILRNRIEIFQKSTGTQKNILLTLITTKGLIANSYSHIIQRLVTLDELF